MRDILSFIMPPILAIIAYLLGRRKTKAELEKLEIENLHSVVNFYKETFRDLEARLKHVSDECKSLYEEITLLRKENVSLKEEIHALNEKLKTYIKS